MKRILLVLMVCTALIVPSMASARDGIDVVDNLSRDYIPAPPGCLAVLAYYEHLSADKLFSDDDEVTDNLNLSGNVGLFRVVYYTEVGPFIIDPQFIIPFGDISVGGTGGADDISTSGFGDPILLATIWFIHDTTSMTYLGFTPFFQIPVGEYDDDKHGLNLAGNRWKFQEELGFVKGFPVLPDHNAYFELQVGGVFQTDNDDISIGGREVEESTDPILKVESHLSYDITKAFYASADYYFHWGGEDELDGVKQDNALNTHTLGGTVGWNIAPSFQVLFQYKHDVQVDNGPEQQVVLFRFLYACDVGYLFGSPAAANK